MILSTLSLNQLHSRLMTNSCAGITGICTQSPVKSGCVLSLTSGTFSLLCTWLLLLISSALLFTPQEAFWQLLFGIPNVSNAHYCALLQYKQAFFSFTSGTSKGTSSPLFLRISATIRRVLSLGMTFSSCIFVQTASAFRESFVSSEIIRFFDVTQPREGVSAHIGFSL